MLKKFTMFLMLAAAALSPFSAFAAAENQPQTLELFVATDGDNKNGGTLEKPLATVQAAVKKAEEEKRKNSDLQITISIRGGNYFLNEGIKINSILSGTEEAPFVIQGYNGEEVNLRGSKQINPKDFKPCKNEEVLKRIPEKARQYIGEYDLSQIISGGMDTFEYPFAFGSNASYYSLLVNESDQTLARWPNDGFSHVQQVVNKWNFFVEPENAQRWVNAESAVIAGYFGVQYLKEYEAVNQIAADGNILMRTNAYYGIKVGDRYYIFNLLEELDSPGEYYIDRATQKLYFYPPYTITNAFMEMPILKEAMLTAKNIKNFTIKNVNFKASRGNGIDVSGAQNFTLDGCKLENIGDKALNATGNMKAKIINNDFFHIGGRCIELEGGNRQTLVSSENLVENNHFFNFAKIWASNNPAINLQGVGTTIQHNIFHESSSQAIWFSGNDHKFLYNEMYNLVKEVSDAGAIYAGRDYISRGTEIAYNYIHDIDTSADKSGSIYVAGVYLDDLFSGTNVHHNVLARCHLGVMIGGGRDNKFDNNLIIDCENAMFMDARGVGWGAYHAKPGGQAYSTIFWVQYNQPPWSKKYPELASIFDHGSLGLPYNNSIQNNLMYNYQVNMIASEMVTYGTVKNNTEMKDKPEIFKDYADNNFEIAENAELLKTSPELAHIDMSKVGLDAARVAESTEHSLNAGFRLISPKNGAKNISNLGYLFKWDKHDGSDKYVVKIATDPDMKNVIIEEETVNNYLNIKNIPSGERVLYWTVDGINYSQSLKNTFRQTGAPRMLISYQYEQTDKTELARNVEVCQTLYDNVTEGTEKGTYKQGFKSTVKAVLDNAVVINGSPTALQADIDGASKRVEEVIASIPDNFNYDVVNVGELLKDKENWIYAAGHEKINADDYWTWNEDGSLSLTGVNGRKNHYTICGYDKDLGRATAIKFGYKVNVSSNYCIMGLQPVTTGFLGAGQGYSLIIKSNQIEIQKYVPGYTGNAIKQQILNFYISDDKWVDLEMGALCVGVGTYVYLKANGNVIASFLDTDPPYWNPEAVKFIFTNPSGEMPECYASIRAAKE